MFRPAVALTTLGLLAGLVLAGLAAPAAQPAQRPAPPAARKSAPAARPKASTPAHAPVDTTEPVDLRQNIRYIDGRPDTAGVFLPDSTVLARVNERLITAREFVDTYYNSYAEDRPTGDSLGRVEWLNSMVNKEVLGRVARAANPPLSFEDRLVMREHTQRALSNVLFLRAVLDSAVVSQDGMIATYREFPIEHHVRRIAFADPNLAEQVWKDLHAGRIKWGDAVRRYSLPQDDADRDGDIGWVGRMGMVEEVADQIYPLAPGQFTKPIQVVGGFYIYQSLASRRVEAPPYNSVRAWIYGRLRNARIRDLTERLQAQIRSQIGLTYDTTNIAFASTYFKATVQTKTDSSGTPNIRLNTAMPVFRSADTSRVLARWRDGRMTVAGFLGHYSTLPPLVRPTVNQPELLRRTLDTFVLEPYNADIARARGLDRDSMAVALIEKERERLLVEHLYRDSVEARISVSVPERRKYYESHLPMFFTYPAAHYAHFLADDSLKVQALAARLRSGVDAAQIVREDSIAGRRRYSAIKVERDNDHGEFHRMLFEELKPGKFEIIGPDRKGKYALIQMLSFDPGRQLSFEEGDGYAYDAIQSQKAEEMLNALLDRHKRGLRIETHPELVARIRLVDPVTDLR